MIRWLLHLRCGTSAQHRHDFGILGRPSSSTTGTDDGGIDAPQMPPEFPVAFQVIQEVGDETSPGTILPPAAEAVVGGLPGTIAFGEVAPGSAGVANPQDRIEDGGDSRDDRGHLDGWDVATSGQSAPRGVGKVRNVCAWEVSCQE